MTLTLSFIKKVEEFNHQAFLYCHELDQKYFPTPWSSRDWQVLFEGTPKLLGLIYKQGEIKGFILFDVSVADSFAHLLKIIIHPADRRKDLGARLLSEALKELRDQGIKSFFLEVEETNTSAIGLYEKAGFKKIHLKKHFYHNGASAVIMTQEL